MKLEEKLIYETALNMKMTPEEAKAYIKSHERFIKELEKHGLVVES
jgi:hypothetical protein